MLEEIKKLLLSTYGSKTGGLNIEVKFSKGCENPDIIKDMFKVIEDTLENADNFEASNIKFTRKYVEGEEDEEEQEEDAEAELVNKNAIKENPKTEIEPEDEEEEDETLDDKYYVLFYNEEPYIPQQNYFNSFYTVDQVMYSKQEAEEAIEQANAEDEGAYNENEYEEEEG